VSYDLYVEPEVHAARAHLPGNMRQRLRPAITALAAAPRPPDSPQIDTTSLDLRGDIEIRRLRMDRWHIVYALYDGEQWVWVLALHRRPPYDYGDLPDLIGRLPAE
jgi:hypothetical protein